MPRSVRQRRNTPAPPVAVSPLTQRQTRSIQRRTGRVNNQRPSDAIEITTEVARDVAIKLSGGRASGVDVLVQQAKAKLTQNCWNQFFSETDRAKELHSAFIEQVDNKNLAEGGRTQLRLTTKLLHVIRHAQLCQANADALGVIQDTPEDTVDLDQVQRDILALKKEFQDAYVLPGVRNRRAESIVVITKPVTLTAHDVVAELGRFSIQVNIKTPGRFSVVALEPNMRRSYPHPHVSADGAMCVGDGEELLNKALESCDFFSYFMVINSILNTYGEASPYVSIDEWGEAEPTQECNECGEYVTLWRQCHACQNFYCLAHCNRMCQSCAMWTCSNCAHTCAICVVSNRHCVTCATECSQCHSKHYCNRHRTTCGVCHAVVCPPDVNTCASTCVLCTRVVCNGCLQSCSGCSRRCCRARSCWRQGTCVSCSRGGVSVRTTRTRQRAQSAGATGTQAQHVRDGQDRLASPSDGERSRRIPRSRGRRSAVNH